MNSHSWLGHGVLGQAESAQPAEHGPPQRANGTGALPNYRPAPRWRGAPPGGFSA